MPETRPPSNERVEPRAVALGTTVVDVHTRLLYPFSFSRRSIPEATARFKQLTFKQRPVWQLFDSESIDSDYYTTEAHGSVASMLFGVKGHGCYLSLVPETANAMLSRKLFMTQKQSFPQLPCQFVQPAPAAEVFLSPFGVGLLSLTLKLDVEQMPNATFADALIFNYRLSQLREWMEASLACPHPSDNAETWSRIPANQRIGIPTAPSLESPLQDRLNAPGGVYKTTELIQFLLEPLALDSDYKPGASQMSVYTVARVGQQVDFSNASTRESLSSILSGLAQVEEAIHAGSLPDEPGIDNEILNRNHWAGVGCLGAAHIVSDQADDIAFNEERLQRSRDRYFVAYLPAYMQRLALQRAADLIGRTIQTNSLANVDSCGPEFRRILHDMTEFNAVAFPPDVSNRQVINRYYRLAQKGMQVNRAWELVTDNIRNLEAVCRTSQQEKQLAESGALLEKQKDLLEESKDLHAKVEWVEVFIVAVYFAELVHIVGGSLFEHNYVGWSALIGSTGAMAAALFVLRPWHSLSLKGLKTVSAVMCLAVTLFLIVGVLKFPQSHTNSNNHGEGHNSSEPPTDHAAVAPANHAADNATGNTKVNAKDQSKEQPTDQRENTPKGEVRSN